MNIYALKERLKQYDKAIFSIAEIARILDMSRNAASVYVNRMKKKNLVYTLERGKISITEDAFVAASQIVFPGYISFASALYLHNVISQVINEVYMATSRKTKSREFLGTKIKFIRLPAKLMFGYRKINYRDGKIMLADLEKAILDALYNLKYCRLNYIFEALKKADIIKLEDYAKRMNKEAANRRLGYLLDTAGIGHKIRKRNNNIYKLNPLLKKRGIFDKKWYIYINEEVKNA